jgi:hypothetical protein
MHNHPLTQIKFIGPLKVKNVMEETKFCQRQFIGNVVLNYVLYMCRIQETLT